MQIAMIAAGFTPGMADDLRRSMAAWKRKGGVHRFEEPLKQGMKDRGYPAEFADRIVVLHNGQRVAEGEPAAVIASPVVQNAYLGVGTAEETL